MRRARSEATTPYSVRPRSPPPRYLRASPQNQLIRESHLHTGRGVADKRGLVGLALDVFPIDKGKRKQQEAEQEEDEDNDEDEGPQQEVTDVAHWQRR
jgi:hypothetical protein